MSEIVDHIDTSLTDRPIRIAICDDEIKFIDKIKSALFKIQKDHDIHMEIKAFEKPADLIRLLRADIDSVEILLLDIQIHNESGIDIARKIHGINKEIIIIFVSGFDSFMQLGYEVNAFRYILKSQISSYLDKNILAAVNELQKRSSQFFDYKVKGEIYRLRFTEIIYFESFQRQIQVVTAKNQDLFYGKLDEIEIQLKDFRFVRCHKSYLVNVDYIESITTNFVKLKGSYNIPISRGKFETVRKALVWSMR
jgi:two-component system, LytTR family, response regulator LytT